LRRQVPKCENCTLVLFLEERSLGYTVVVKKPAKNPAAVALGKLSAASKTPEERREHGSKGGSIGGKARAKALTKKQRSDIAKAAARARWAKKDS
jgi:hypothetical protein